MMRSVKIQIRRVPPQMRDGALKCKETKSDGKALI